MAAHIRATLNKISPVLARQSRSAHKGAVALQLTRVDPGLMQGLPILRGEDVARAAAVGPGRAREHGEGGGGVGH
jgi:hypothetical protein